MARITLETATPGRHCDFMRDWTIGGSSVIPPRDNLLGRKVLLVEVCGFTFQFHSRAQLAEALRWFSRLVHPSGRASTRPRKHWYHPWHARLPAGLTAKSKRRRIQGALARAWAAHADALPTTPDSRQPGP